MFLNLYVIVPVVIVSIAVVVQCKDKITTKYFPDDNRIIKRLHGSTHAKQFLHGCDAEPYIQLDTNSTTESKRFNLQKSEEYLFAIFTLEEVSIIISNDGVSSNVSNITNVMWFNITLGINKNSMAMLEVFSEEGLVDNITQEVAPILPTVPYYVNVSITDDNISVYEARTGSHEPFLHSNYYSNINLTSESFFVSFRHSSAIYAHYDCCEECTPWIYTRISGCSKYSARTASAESETIYPLRASQSSNRTSSTLFTQNIVVNHDGNPMFGAKIIFSESENLRINRYEIGLSNTPSIFHYVNSSSHYTKSLTGLPLKQAYTWPFIVNITITSDGFVSLRQPHEEFPFLYYHARYHSKLNPVDVKHMTMVKFHEDFIRYDFYHNCTDVLSFDSRDEPIDQNEYFKNKDQTCGLELCEIDNNTDSYPIIWEYVSKQFNEIKFDVLHIYHDSYQVYDKTISKAFEDSGEYGDQSANATILGKQSAGKTKDDESLFGEFSGMIKKAIVSVGSFLFIGLVKIICSLDFVKNLLREADVDDDKMKDLSKKMGKTVVSESVISKTFGFGSDDAYEDDGDE